MSNTRYFNTQKIALDHHVEEKDINYTLHHEVGLGDDDGEDLAFDELQQVWLEEDARAGIMHVVSGCFGASNGDLVANIIVRAER